ncbi:hypothetical protein GALMADRAFT_142890 [Galerina marginata CBS 339.88]|uniref:Uncharacterized protein n=1 Tax=Galerina marginata (strain CBS 339.88) TaxID=685588 RepID=A0A067SNV0_GALM3|nr:hypothetical protein GALMADRAFT_142890 [Galerina marginata CBS 339.88]
MDPTPPQIKVYSSFPLAVALDSDLNLDPNNSHSPTPAASGSTRSRTSRTSYKWVRYTTGIVVGADEDLSNRSNLPNSQQRNNGEVHKKKEQTVQGTKVDSERGIE